MKMNDIETAEQLRDFMTEPTDALVEFLGGLQGDVLVLGAGGKMGPELVETIVRADRQAGASRRILAVSRFSDPAGRAKERFLELGVHVLAGDLTERAFLDTLPDAPHVIYMLGVKFGTSEDWRRAFHLNSIVPYLVGEKLRDSAIVVFSSTNPYPPVPPRHGGCRETDDLAPQGIYGWSIVARESSFRTTAMMSPAQRLCFFRLAYAQHLAYGVLVDVARMVWQGEAVSLAVPAVNLVSQRDAIDVALRALGHCANPPFALNCAGPIVRVREIVERMGAIMGKEPRLAGPEGQSAGIADDTLRQRTFGPGRDGVDEMVEAAAKWVMRGGESWDKPTMFGRADRNY